MGKDGGGGGSPVHPQCALLNGPILRRRGEDLWRDTGPQTIALIVTRGGRAMAPGQISYQKNIGNY